MIVLLPITNALAPTLYFPHLEIIQYLQYPNRGYGADPRTLKIQFDLIIKGIEDHVAGTYTPSPGVIYPTLTMLEELGHATMTESNGKKFYTVTEAGTAYLETNKAAVDHALQRMQSVNSAHSGSRAPRAFFTRTGVHPGSNPGQALARKRSYTNN